MDVGARNLKSVLRAPFLRQNYVAAIGMFRVYKNPVDMFKRYVFGAGEYPIDVAVDTPIGPLKLTVYSKHDVLTVNEIFCRLDYAADDRDRMIVDFGSNIGVSAAYFLSRSTSSFAYLFEPLVQNVERLHRNLLPFKQRYHLDPVAVGLTDGSVDFGWEPSGRYGGIGREVGDWVKVDCRDSNRILEDIVGRHGVIDILKIDIESLERDLTERIPDDIARNIRKIYIENQFSQNPLPRSHQHLRYGNITKLITSGSHQS